MKAQDNISKRAAVEKETSTLEKDKEDQSKYYLSYPKPSVLDMKCENCDSNVVERTNIPKFSKQDDIVTPLRLPELFFDDVLVNMIVGYTNLYSHREKADTSLEITNEKIHLFLNMLLLRGFHKLPDREIYWETTADTFEQARSDSIPRDAFERILRSLQL